ncbi:MAG: sugar phosphate nucleotidyltransferase [Candidatus Bathyarchaeia archaeon]
MLIGGFGTRLRPLTCTRPKVLFPILNKPLLQWTYERLAANGIREVILAVNGLTEFYIRQAGVPKCGLTVKYSRDPPKTPLGTGGPIKKAERLLGYEEPFLVLNGDIFADLGYREMIESHREGKALATIALHEAEDPSRYGVAVLAENNHITRFVEKPPKGTAPTNLINAGVYVLSPQIFKYIPAGRAVSMEREVFPRLVENGTLYGHRVSGLWIDIGKPEEYLQTNMTLLDIHASEQRQQGRGKFRLEEPVAIDKGVAIGEGSVIGPHAILGKNVCVGKDVQIWNSVVFSGAKVDDAAVVRGALVGECATIGRNAKVTEGCIVSDQAKIAEGIVLPKKTAVCPAKEVTQDMLKAKSRSIC